MAVPLGRGFKHLQTAEANTKTIKKIDESFNDDHHLIGPFKFSAQSRPPAVSAKEVELSNSSCCKRLKTEKSKFNVTSETSSVKLLKPITSVHIISETVTRIDDTSIKRPHISVPLPKQTVATSENPSTHQSWIEKYRPTKTSQIIGNSKNVTAFKKWVHDHSKYKTGLKLVALLHGPPGIGKTSMAHAVLKEEGYEVYEVNASLDRTSKGIQQTLHDTIMRKSLVGKIAVILDEIDGGVDNDEGAADGVLHFINWLTTNGKNMDVLSPIVCIANDTHGKPMQRLVHAVFSLRFFPPYPDALSKVMTHIIRIEKVKIPEKDKVEIIKQCGGDVRRLVNMIESYCLVSNQNLKEFIKMSVKDSFMNNFNITRHVLVDDKMEIDKSFSLIQSDQSVISYMIQENYVKVFETQSQRLGHSPKSTIDILDRMSDLSDNLSAIDIFDQSTEIYKDDKEDARNLSAIWLNTAIRVNRGKYLPNFDDFGVNIASLYSHHNKTKAYMSQLQHFEASSIIGENCGFLTLFELNNLLSILMIFDTLTLQKIMPQLKQTNWKALSQTRFRYE
jgi:DNA polymerase III delta prime subunit